MARRVTRKMLKENEFISVFDQAMEWMGGNWRPVVAGIGVIAVALLGWWAVWSWLGGRSDQASYLLYRATSALEGKGDKPGSPEAAEPLLREVIERYGRTEQANAARLLLARIDLGRGKTEDARAALLQLAEKNRGTAVGRLATLDLIQLRVASGQAAEVAGELQAMVTAANPQLPRDAALYELGLLLLKEEKASEARTQLEKLVQEFPESPYKGPAQQRLSELG
jgi:predicted negative regulator of RcsB-dependent stress response